MTDENQVAQAEPFEETLNEWRQKVLHQGGTVQEHYAIRLIEMLADGILDMHPGCDYNGCMACAGLRAAVKAGFR